MTSEEPESGPNRTVTVHTACKPPEVQVERAGLAQASLPVPVSLRPTGASVTAYSARARHGVSPGAGLLQGAGPPADSALAARTAALSLRLGASAPNFALP